MKRSHGDENLHSAPWNNGRLMRAKLRIQQFRLQFQVVDMWKQGWNTTNGAYQHLGGQLARVSRVQAFEQLRAGNVVKGYAQIFEPSGEVGLRNQPVTVHIQASHDVPAASKLSAHVVLHSGV